jgi:hypothetical protein
MKKTMIMAILVLATLVSNSQEFMGIAVDGKLSDAVVKFKEKGFTTSTVSPSGTVMKGMMGTKEIELVICNTATTKTVWAFKIYLPKKDSWYSLKNEYLEFLDLLTKKYGEPKSKYDFFTNPYYEGDGYEMSAVANDKCNFASYWVDKYAVDISKYKQVRISYENPVNSELQEKEKNQTLNNSL